MALRIFLCGAAGSNAYGSASPSGTAAAFAG